MLQSGIILVNYHLMIVQTHNSVQSLTIVKHGVKLRVRGLHWNQKQEFGAKAVLHNLEIKQYVYYRSHDYGAHHVSGYAFNQSRWKWRGGTLPAQSQLPMMSNQCFHGFLNNITPYTTALLNSRICSYFLHQHGYDTSAGCNSNNRCILINISF